VKHAAALLLVLVGPAAMAGHHDEIVINSGSELRDWCKEESEAALIGRGLSPFNWSASYWDEVNVLMVKGSWRVNDADVTVECSVARGAQARFASLSFP
jgi:hypothetical protein